MSGVNFNNTTNQALPRNDDGTYTIDTRVMEAEINVVGGIAKGLCCYVTGEITVVKAGVNIDIPKISIASVDDPTTLPIFGVVLKGGANGEIASVINNGLVTGIDTSSFALEDTLYLGLNGVIQNTPEVGVYGIIQLGTVSKVDAIDGSIQIGIQHFYASAELDDVLRKLLKNTSTADGAVATFTVVNDAGKYTYLGITGTGNTGSPFIADRSILYNIGTGGIQFYNDGNFGYLWGSDTGGGFTDKMQLSAAGFLKMLNAGISIDRFLDEDDFVSNSDQALATQQSIKSFVSHDRQEITVEGPITTTSTTFVDVPGVELITANLGQSGSYQVWLSISVQQTSNNSTINFRPLINGVPGNTRSVDFGPGAANDPQHATLIAQRDIIETDSLVKLQWNVNIGTGQINNLVMMIDGIPESRVVPVISPGVDSYLLETGIDALLKEEGTFLLVE